VVIIEENYPPIVSMIDEFSPIIMCHYGFMTKISVAKMSFK
jgi:hypothetical protein